VTLAVSSWLWAAFGAALAVSLLVILWGVLQLVRRLKEFGATTRRLSEELGAAMETVNDQLERATDGMNRLGERRLRRD
jgi:hypothetical protein